MQSESGTVFAMVGYTVRTRTSCIAGTLPNGIGELPGQGYYVLIQVNAARGTASVCGVLQLPYN